MIILLINTQQGLQRGFLLIMGASIDGLERVHAIIPAGECHYPSPLGGCTPELAC
jgi:hypothetical protein